MCELCYQLASDAQYPRVTEASSSQRTIIIASALFFLVLVPVGSQTPPPWQTLRERALSPPTPTVGPSPLPIPPIKEMATLNVSPAPPIEVGKPVEFEVVVQPAPPPGWNLQYHFDFGDGSTAETSQPRMPHTYFSPAPEAYSASVEITERYGNRVIGNSRFDKRVEVIQSNPPPSATVSVGNTPQSVPNTSSSPTAIATRRSHIIATAPPSNVASPTATPWRRKQDTPWVFYIVVIGLVVVVVRYLVRPKPEPIPVPLPIPPPIVVTFHPHSDWDAPQESQKDVPINYELHFDPNMSKGRARIETDRASLIIRKKEQ
jgi:hypothetical protein